MVVMHVTQQDRSDIFDGAPGANQAFEAPGAAVEQNPLSLTFDEYGSARPVRIECGAPT